MVSSGGGLRVRPIAGLMALTPAPCEVPTLAPPVMYEGPPPLILAPGEALQFTSGGTQSLQPKVPLISSVRSTEVMANLT